MEELTRFGMKQAILLVHSVYRLVCEGETGDVRGGGGGRHGPQCVVCALMFVRAVSSFIPRCVVAVLLRLRYVCASAVSAIVHFYERVVSKFLPAMMDDHAGRHPTTHEKKDGSIVIGSALFSRKGAGHVYRVQLTALSAFWFSSCIQILADKF